MRYLALVLTFVSCGQTAVAGRVNWSHFLKISPWTFEPDEVRHPNHSNVPPSVIEKLIALDELDLSPSKRMLRAAQGISEKPNLHSEQRALLMRDALDGIHDRHPKWTAYDAAATHAVIFYGGELETKEHLALAVCLKSGQIYRGAISCATLLEASILVDFASSPSWKPITPSRRP